MVGFRNVIVHGYDTVDLAVVRDVCRAASGGPPVVRSGHPLPDLIDLFMRART
jgi:hypothetical protein